MTSLIIAPYLPHYRNAPLLFHYRLCLSTIPCRQRLSPHSRIPHPKFHHEHQEGPHVIRIALVIPPNHTLRDRKPEPCPPFHNNHVLNYPGSTIEHLNLQPANFFDLLHRPDSLSSFPAKF